MVTKDIVRSCVSDGVTTATASLTQGISLRLTDPTFVSQFSPSALAEIVPLLVSLWHEVESTLSRKDKVVSSFLETSARKLTEAVASRTLSASEMVNILWAYGAEEIQAQHSRDLFDQCNMALRGFSASEYQPPCTGCPPPNDTTSGEDVPCVVNDEQTLIPLATLTGEELGRLAWSYVRARSVDARHRTITDRPLFDLIAKAYVGEGHADTSPSDLTVGLVHVYSSISHYDGGFYDSLSVSLSKKIDDFSDPALALSVMNSFSRVKHGKSKQAKALLTGVYTKAQDVLECFDLSELVQISSCMADLGLASKPLLLSICERVEKEMDKIEPPQALALIRALANLQHIDSAFVKYQETLLLRLRKTFLEVNVEDMSSHCGSGGSGIEK